MNNLSNLVKAARLSKGMNKAQLAREAGVSSRTIDRAENGEQIGEVSQHKIAIALKVSVGELFPEAAGS